MAKDKKRELMVILAGSAITGLLTLLATFGFSDAGINTVTRNIIISVIIFNAAYVIWIKVFSTYETMYRRGLE